VCFDYDNYPTFFREQHVKARKHHRCCECSLPICPGEEYQSYFGVWDGEPRTYRTCSVCAWFRERVAESEMEHGCRAHEAYPAFGELLEALGEGHARSIGQIDLNEWHEREEMYV
jgi:hypothetical protein